MKEPGGSDEAKQRAGENAAARVENGMVVGLGTGSTAAHAIRALGRRRAEGFDIEGIPTSLGARRLAVENGIPIVGLDERTVDIVIDGADRIVVGENRLIKGGGAAHAREKVLASAAERVHIVVDETKLAETLDAPIPLEVLPDARPVIEREIESMGGDPVLREASEKDGPLVTDNGNLVLDCAFGRIETPETLAASLSERAGCVEHGLFCGIADVCHVGSEAGVETIDLSE